MNVKELLLLIDSIAQQSGTSKPWLVGGVPRDLYLKKNNSFNDLDITTGDQTISILSKEVAIALKNLKPIYRLMDDGHSRIILGPLKLDFSSNFVVPEIEKIYTKNFGRAPNSMEMELYSRDFTCNTLLMPLSFDKPIDLTKQAIPAIEAKIIKTCLNPDITLGLDPKRIVRAVYLSAKLGFELDIETSTWIKNNINILSQVKPQYITKKIAKALSYNKNITVELLDFLQLWPYLPVNKHNIDMIKQNLVTT